MEGRGEIENREEQGEKNMILSWLASFYIVSLRTVYRKWELHTKTGFFFMTFVWKDYVAITECPANMFTYELQNTAYNSYKSNNKSIYSYNKTK